jgi:hypothetical protein
LRVDPLVDELSTQKPGSIAFPDFGRSAIKPRSWVVFPARRRRIRPCPVQWCDIASGWRARTRRRGRRGRRKRGAATKLEMCAV